MSPNMRTLLDYLEAYNSKNIQKMLSCFNDDCRFENISNHSPSTVITGKPSLKEQAEYAATLFSVREQKILVSYEEDNRIALELSYTATLAKDVNEKLKKNDQIKLHGASFFEFKNGKISSLKDLS